jgi:hypothetical protein
MGVMSEAEVKARMAKLEGMGFERAIPAPARRLVVSVSGRTATGKTRFALTAPGPIAYFEMDLAGLEGPLAASGRKDVMRKVIMVDPEKVFSADLGELGSGGKPTGKGAREVKEAADEAVRAWREFKQMFIAAVKGGVRTVVLDQSTDAWRLCRMAYFLPEFGRTGKIEPIHYEQPKHDFFTMIDLVKMTSDVNLILVHRDKDEYKGKTKIDGGVVVAGPPEVEAACHVCIRLAKDETRGVGIEGKFSGEIFKCRQNTMLEGMRLPSEEMKMDEDGVPVVDDEGDPVVESVGLDFPSVAALVEGTSKEAWM